MVRIAGMGAVSSCGAGADALTAALRAGVGTSTPGRAFGACLPPGLRLNQYAARPHAPGAKSSIAIQPIIIDSIKEALVDASLAAEDIKDAGLIIGTSGFLAEAESGYIADREAGAQAVPLKLRGTGRVATHIAGALGMRGPVVTLTTACTSSANALLVAAGMIERAELRRAVVAGAEVLSAFAVNGFSSMMLLSPQGCRPFDAERSGIQLGEACAAVILEAASEGRGDYICGGANVCDTHNVISTNIDGGAVMGVMADAIRRARIGKGEIRAIKAHGTGSIDNDAAEGAGMKALFKDKVPPFTGFKGYFGHTLGACGAIETVAMVKCLRAGFVPPALGFSKEDRSIGLTPLRVRMEAKPGYYMLNFFGFGGNNTSLILRHLR